MDRLEFSRNIAKSLTLGSWPKECIEKNLSRRLPKILHRLAPKIASDLLLALPTHYAPSVNSVINSLLLIQNFERGFRYCQKHNVWPELDLTSSVMALISALSDLDVPQLPTIGSLAEWLVLPINRLEYLADLHARYEEHGETAINSYHYVLKKKKSNGTRVIEAPKQNSKAIQRRILHGIVEKLPNHPDAFGFVKGRNCLQAASRHAGEEVWSALI